MFGFLNTAEFWNINSIAHSPEAGTVNLNMPSAQ